MKRWRIALIVLLGMVEAQAQAQDECITRFPYKEDFERESKIQLWDLDDDTVATISWTRFSYSYMSSGAICSVSTPHDSTDHWMVLPRLAISDSMYSVEWMMSNFHQGYPHRYAEHVELRVSRTGAEPEDFDTVIFAYTYTEVDRSEPGNSFGFRLFSVPLKDFAGDTVRLAFRHQGADAYWLHIDDVAVYDGTPEIFGITGPDVAGPEDTVTYSVQMRRPESYNISWSIGEEDLIVSETDRDTVMLSFPPDLPGGSYTLRVKAENPINGDSAVCEHPIWYRNCGLPVEEYPYSEHFRHYTCWSSYLAAGEEGWNLNNMAISFGELDKDAWLVSPEFVINQPLMQAEWTEFTADAEIDSQHYSFYYTLDDPSYEDFDTDSFVLLYDTVAAGRDTLARVRVVRIPDELIGRSVWFAFRHHGEMSYVEEGYYLYLGLCDFRLSSYSPPILDSIYGCRIVPRGVPSPYWLNISSADSMSFYWTFEGARDEISYSTTPLAVWDSVPSGMYQVSLDVGNPYGSTTDTFYVEVIDCEPEQVPYDDRFESERRCWFSRNEGHDGTDWRVTDGIPGYYSQLMTSHSDHWLISPQFVIPQEGETDVLMNLSGSEQEEFSIYVSRGGGDIPDFEDMLFAGEHGRRDLYRFGLQDYKGDTIRLAIRHHGVHTYYLQLDRFAILPLEPPSVAIRPLSQRVTADRESAFVAESRNPDTYADHYRWYVDDQPAGCDSDTLKAVLAEGPHQIAVCAENRTGTAWDTLQVEARVGICAPDTETESRITPNPAHDHLTITLASTSELRSVKICDIMGRTLLSRTLEGNICQLPLGSLPAGLYLVRIETSTGIETHRLVIE